MIMLYNHLSPNLDSFQSAWVKKGFLPQHGTQMNYQCRTFFALGKERESDCNAFWVANAPEV